MCFDALETKKLKLFLAEPRAVLLILLSSAYFQLPTSYVVIMMHDKAQT